MILARRKSAWRRSNRPVNRFVALRSTIGYRDRVHFYEAMEAATAQGMPLPTAVHNYQAIETRGGKRKSRFGRLLARWHRDLSGESSRGFVPHLHEITAGYFPPIERVFLQVAEGASGAKVEDGFKAAANYATTMKELTDKASASWTGPALLLLQNFLLFMLSAGVRRWVFDRLDMPIELTGFAYYYVAFSDATLRWGPPIVLLSILGYLWLKWLLPNWPGASRRWADARMPVFNGYREFQGGQVLIAVAHMLSIGMTPAIAVYRLIETATPWMKSYLKPLHLHLATQKNDLSDGLWAIGGDFPSEFVTRKIKGFADSNRFEKGATQILEREAKAIIGRYTDRISSIRTVMLVIAASLTALQGFGDVMVIDQVNKSISKSINS